MMNQLSKFKGCLLGALIGDSFGAAYEFRPRSASAQAEHRMKSIVSGKPDDGDRLLEYTDDTAMMIGLCDSLVTKQDLDQQHLARTFSEHFFKDPHRGYGATVREVFVKLRDNDYSDVLTPAATQFDGLGSHGNGGAMRIAPLALFGEKRAKGDNQALIELAKKATVVTHSNPNGVVGAVLQCLAVNAALQSDITTLDPVSFVRTLRESIISLDGADIFLQQLEVMEKHFTDSENGAVDIPWVVKNFGHDVVAHKSVTAALFAFLRSLKPVPDIDFDNSFCRCILLAVSLGGDTDTISCMAGAMSGALLGMEAIPDKLISACEYHKQLSKFAEDLHNLSETK